MCDLFGPPRFHCPFPRYSVRQNRTHVYVLGYHKNKSNSCVLRIPRTSGMHIGLEEGVNIEPLSDNLARLEEMKLEILCDEAYGLFGFIRFLQGYYICVITKRSKRLGTMGHHAVYTIEKTRLIPIFLLSRTNDALNRDEQRLKDLFFCKDFFFSYTYDLVGSVQKNQADYRKPDAKDPFYSDPNYFRFVWNKHLLEPLRREPPEFRHWILPIIHGFFRHESCSTNSSWFDMVLIARRSSFFAGTRYRKRGVNPEGFVGNDVETEQVVWDGSMRHFGSGHVLSFLQMRGSVPLFWNQEAAATRFKPPFKYRLCDPTIASTRNHVKDLYQRYGHPLWFVNLMKHKQESSQESELSQFFVNAVNRLNMELPKMLQIIYRPMDLKGMQRSQALIYTRLQELSSELVKSVGFCHLTTDGPRRLQNGALRTNCVDCLDRTNVLQFFVGLEALQHQLAEICILPPTIVPRTTEDIGQLEVFFLLQNMYDMMGDALAMQYAGSVTHKKYQLIARPDKNNNKNNSKELLTSVYRHYSNRFGDAEKQTSINLLLGIYNPIEHPRPWIFDGLDTWLHHGTLLNDYDPKNWWEAPLEKYAEQALRGLQNETWNRLSFVPQSGPNRNVTKKNTTDENENNDEAKDLDWFDTVYKNGHAFVDTWMPMIKTRFHYRTEVNAEKLDPLTADASPTKLMRVYAHWKESNRNVECLASPWVVLYNRYEHARRAEEGWINDVFSPSSLENEAKNEHYVDVRGSMRAVNEQIAVREKEREAGEKEGSDARFFRLISCNIFTACEENHATSTRTSTTTNFRPVNSKIGPLNHKIAMMFKTHYDAPYEPDGTEKNLCNYFLWLSQFISPAMSSSKSSCHQHNYSKSSSMLVHNNNSGSGCSASASAFQQHKEDVTSMSRGDIGEVFFHSPRYINKVVPELPMSMRAAEPTMMMMSARGGAGFTTPRYNNNNGHNLQYLPGSHHARWILKERPRRVRICVKCNDPFPADTPRSELCNECVAHEKSVHTLLKSPGTSTALRSNRAGDQGGSDTNRRRRMNARLRPSSGRSWTMGVNMAMCNDNTNFVPSARKLEEGSARLREMIGDDKMVEGVGHVISPPSATAPPVHVTPNTTPRSLASSEENLCKRWSFGDNWGTNPNSFSIFNDTLDYELERMFCRSPACELEEFEEIGIRPTHVKRSMANWPIEDEETY